QRPSSQGDFWSSNSIPVRLDQSVQIAEYMIDGDIRGLRIVLQLLIQDQWTAIYEYHVFPDEVTIVQHQKRQGRKRFKKTLPAKQSRQMAWNHFRHNWKSICDEFWSS